MLIHNNQIILSAEVLIDENLINDYQLPLNYSFRASFYLDGLEHSFFSEITPETLIDIGVKKAKVRIHLPKVKELVDQVSKGLDFYVGGYNYPLLKGKILSPSSPASPSM